MGLWQTFVDLVLSNVFAAFWNALLSLFGAGV